MLSSHSIVASSRTARSCSPRIGQWIGQWRTTWSTIYSSAPHTHAVGRDRTLFVQAEAQKSDTAAEAVKPDSRFSWQGHSRRVGAGVGDESAESCRVVQPLHIPLGIRFDRRTFVVVVRWTDWLCGGCKWVFPFETACIGTRLTGECWVEQVSRLHGTTC